MVSSANEKERQFAMEHGQLVGPRPLEGHGVLYTSGVWGGACNNVHVNLWRKDMLVCCCR